LRQASQPLPRERGIKIETVCPTAVGGRPDDSQTLFCRFKTGDAVGVWDRQVGRVVSGVQAAELIEKQLMGDPIYSLFGYLVFIYLLDPIYYQWPNAHQKI
jgi:hypothetical protein